MLSWAAEAVAEHQGLSLLTGEYYRPIIECEMGLMAIVQCIYAKRAFEEEETEDWDAEIVVWDGR
jgi:hypothetical protein